MRNIRLTIEYDGSRYRGWGRPGKNEGGGTISGKLLEVIKKLTGETPELFCGQRTEGGVHAYAQTANFKTKADMPAAKLQYELNRYLPMDIAVIKAEEAPDRFHAQLNAKSVVYMYRMTIDDVPSVFDRKFTYHCFRPPDKDAMRKAALLFTGKHDFRNLSTAKQAKGSEKEIYQIDIYGDLEEIQITICASGFLHNMARLIIGSLLDIGMGSRETGDAAKILAGTAPPSPPCEPNGLYLQEIRY